MPSRTTGHRLPLLACNTLQRDVVWQLVDVVHKGQGNRPQRHSLPWQVDPIDPNIHSLPWLQSVSASSSVTYLPVAWIPCYQPHDRIPGAVCFNALVNMTLIIFLITKKIKLQKEWLRLQFEKTQQYPIITQTHLFEVLTPVNLTILQTVYLKLHNHHYKGEQAFHPYNMHCKLQFQHLIWGMATTHA